MKQLTILDYVLFQLDSSRTRCELWIASGTATEKLATGLFNPFLCHLQVAKKQMADGVMSVRLSPSSFSDGNFINDFHWFSKGTIERFVRFVSTPEVIERVFTVESKIKHLGEISNAIAAESFCDGGDCAMSTATLATKGSSDIDAFHHLLLKASNQPVKETLFESHKNDADIKRWLLLKVLNSEWHKLQKMQDLIFHQAASAGFDIEHIPDLLVFADCFGAPQLRNSCSKFLALLEKRQSSPFCLDVPGFEASLCPATNIAPMDYPRYFGSAEDNWFSPDISKGVLNFNKALNHLSHDVHVVGPAENLVSDAPLFSQLSSAIAACKAAGLFHECVTVAGSGANLFTFDELQPCESETTYRQNLLVNPEDGCFPINSHDCHVALEEQNSQLESVGQGGSTMPCLMENAVNYDKRDILEEPEGIHKDSYTEQVDDSPPISSLTYKCRTGEACEFLACSSASNVVCQSKKCTGCNIAETRSSHIEAVTNQFDHIHQNATEQLKEKLEDQQNLSCLANQENLDKLNAQPCEESHVRQVVKFFAAHVPEDNTESIFVQTELESLQVLSEGYNQDLFSISTSNYLAERKGRFYEHYLKHRDAKLRKESALRKAEKKAKLEALQEVLEKRKAEMTSTKMLPVKRHLLTEHALQGNNVSGKPNSPTHKTENMANALEERSTPHQQLSKIGSFSARKVVSISHKSMRTSTSQSSWHTIVSPSQKPVSTFSSKSLPKHHSSTLTKTRKKAEKTLRKSAPVSPKEPLKEATKPLCRKDGKHSQQDKGGFLNARKSKACANASCRRPSYKTYPSKSNSFSSSPSEHTEKHSIFPGRKRITAFADSNSMQTPLHSSESVTMRIVQSQSQPQNKAYKVSLTLTVTKNSKPFLRKGRGIGPGAGPGILKLKASLASDSNKIHNEDLLQTPESPYAETIATFRVDKQTEESSEELNQIECLESSSKATGSVFPVDRIETCSIDFSPESIDANQCSSLHCVVSMEDPEDDISALRSSSGSLTMHPADQQSNCVSSNTASNTLLSPSSLNCRLEKPFNEDDDCVDVPLVSNMPQFTPKDIHGDSHERDSSNPAASSVRTLCGITQLCYFTPKSSVTSGTAEFWKNSGARKNVRGPPSAKQSRRLLRRLKSFLRFKRKVQSLQKQN